MLWRTLEESQTTVTLRAGVISFTHLPDSVDEMIHQADALMYKAKTGGKHKILFAES